MINVVQHKDKALLLCIMHVLKIIHGCIIVFVLDYIILLGGLFLKWSIDPLPFSFFSTSETGCETFKAA